MVTECCDLAGGHGAHFRIYARSTSTQLFSKFLPDVPDLDSMAHVHVCTNHHVTRQMDVNINSRARFLRTSLDSSHGLDLNSTVVTSMQVEMYNRGRIDTSKVLWVSAKLIAAIFCTIILAFEPKLLDSYQFDLRKYFSGALGAFFTLLFVESLEMMIWGVLNKSLNSPTGVSINDLKTVMSLVGGFEGTRHCSNFALVSFFIYALKAVGPVLIALVFSTGFSTEETWTDASVGVIDMTEIGGCFQSKCIATSASVLGLLNFSSIDETNFDGANMSGQGEANIFYPILPQAAVESYWSSSPGRAPVFSIKQLPGLFVEATTTTLEAYPSMKHSIETTISQAYLNLSYSASIKEEGVFSMELAGQVLSSYRTTVFLFTSNVSCATADTTIITQNGNISITATELHPVSDCKWDNSSLEMWRSFGSSIGLAIRYNYNAWFHYLANDTNPSRQISRMLGSVVAHRLSTGEATIKIYGGTYEGTTQFVEYRERVTRWMAYVAGTFLFMYILRVAQLVWIPCFLLRLDLLSFADFLSNFRAIPPATTHVKAEGNVRDNRP